MPKNKRGIPINLKDKKILVTGGSGFIGTRLIKKLTALGATIDNYDLTNGQDIENVSQLKNFVAREYDIIFHLAGFSGSHQSNIQRLKSFRLNLFATVDLYELIIKYSPKTKLIISSSRLEYGKPQYIPVDENHPTIPTSAYGLSKLAATQMALIYHARNNLDITIFRTSNVYGPHPKASFQGYNVINFFIDLAKRGKVLTIFGKGQQERDYLFVDDLVEAFTLATARKSTGQIYNLGSGIGIKLADMAKLIVRIVSRGKVKFVKWPANYKEVETGSYISDISKVKKELGFIPKTSFEEGIMRTIIED